ncbi:MAG: hypothetical protein R6V85_11600 [Polyangia bacterium]
MSRDRSRVVLSLDADWAPDHVLEDTLELLVDAEIPFTLFCTHETPLLDRFRELDGSELSIHPNLYDVAPGPSAAESGPLHAARRARALAEYRRKIAELKRIVPEARGMRCHDLLCSSSIAAIFANEGFEYMSSRVAWLEPGLRASRHHSGLVELPIWLEDDIWFSRDERGPRPDELAFALEDDGLKVLSFHPIHLFLNTCSPAHYREAALHVGDEAALREWVNTSERGVRDLFREIVGAAGRGFGIEHNLLSWSEGFDAGESSAHERRKPAKSAGRRRSPCVLLTGCGGPLGVNLTRSLIASSLGPRLLGTEANPWHRHLSLAEKTFVVPRASGETEAYLAELGRIIEREGVDFVFPSNPVEVFTLAANRKSLAPARVFLPGSDVIATGQNKWATYLAWRDAGLPVPETLLIERFDDAEEAFRRLGSKIVWVRGAGVPGAGIGVASLAVRDPDSLRAWVDHWEGWGRMIASEYLPGRNLTWLSVWKEGELLATQSRERLEYVIPHVSPSGITGAPAVSRTIRCDPLDEIGRRALRALAPEPHGVFFIDFKEREGGDPRMTEVNAGRFGTTIHFYTEAGFNFPELALRAGLDLSLPDDLPRLDVLPEGYAWIRTLDCGPALVDPEGGVEKLFLPGGGRRSDA